MIIQNDKSLKNIKTKTIVAFLRSNNWNLIKKTDTSFLLKPPAVFNAAEHARLRIPLPAYEQAEDFPMVISLVLNTISVLYDTDKKKLAALFSQFLEDLKADLSLKKQILEFAE